MRNVRLLSTCCLGIAGSLALVACDGSRASEVLATLPPAEIQAGQSPGGFSAPAMFFVSIGLSSSTPEAACPAQRVEGDVRIIEGGCTDDSGREWLGRVTIPSSFTGTPFGTGTIVYEDFGSDDPTSCADRPGERRQQIVDGTVVVDGTDTSLEFDSDLVITVSGVLEDCTEGERRAAIDYTGSMARDGETRTTWSGSGSIGAEEIGRYDVHTDDEVLDSSVCNSEPLSGSTTITAGEDVAIVTYDGETDCDMEGTATWTLNGADQGELTGVQCSASPGRGGSASLALLALGAAIAWRLRRRAR